MTIEVVDITEVQRDKILALDAESHFSDLKAIEIKPAKLSKAISAFANASGGELYIGIDQVEIMGVDVNFWRGFNIPEDANGHIQCFEGLFPLGQYFSYTFLRAPGVPARVQPAHAVARGMIPVCRHRHQGGRRQQ